MKKSILLWAAAAVLAAAPLQAADRAQSSNDLQLQAVIDEQRTTIDQLQAERQGLLAQLAALQEENARLNEALQRAGDAAGGGEVRPT